MKMQSSKVLYSRCFKDYVLSDEQMKRLQGALLNILLDIQSVCDQHGIGMMLTGGTLLGAIRHKAFIPWDDDIDVMMLRSEYDRFIPLFRQAFPDKYELLEPMDRDTCVSKVTKVYQKGTTYVEIPMAGVHGPDMIFVDIFVLENIPKPGLWRKIKGALFEFASKASSVCIEYRYPSPVIEEKAKTDAELKQYYDFRKRLGSVFSHLGGLKFYLKMCSRIANQKKETGWVSIPSGAGYLRECFPREMFTRLTRKTFCGHSFSVMEDYNAYLTNLFGPDYMTPPPPEKREYHVAYKLEI